MCLVLGVILEGMGRPFQYDGSSVSLAGSLQIDALHGISRVPILKLHGLLFGLQTYLQSRRVSLHSCW